jgi:hypothetical protein
MPVVLHYLDDVHRQFFANDVTRCPFLDGRLSPVVAQLIVNECIVRESGQQLLDIETVGRFDIGRHERRKRGRRDLRKTEGGHDKACEVVERG